jgi:putative tricarboxylic transport membrane protein
VSTGKKNLIVGLACMAFSVLIFWNTFYLPPPLQPQAPGPATFPRIIVIVLFLLSGLLAWQGWAAKSAEAGKDKPVNYRRFFTLVGLIALYLALLPYLGFVTTSFLYMAVTMMIIKVSWGRSLLYSLIAVAVYYLVFAVMLGIRLPREFFL